MSTKQSQSTNTPSQESKGAPGVGPRDGAGSQTTHAKPLDQNINHNSHRQQPMTPRESKKDGNT